MKPSLGNSALPVPAVSLACVAREIEVPAKAAELHLLELEERP